MKENYYHLDARPTEPLQVTAVRYQPENPPATGITLILTHATSTHKETWVPFLDFLFSLQAQSQSDNAPKIMEAWSIEIAEHPNHGESAVINEKDIADKYPNFAWSGWIYPRAILAFLLSRPDGVDFRTRNLVGIGHSNGGNTLVLLDSLQTTFTFQYFILLDATICREAPEKDHMLRLLTQITWNKRDTWPSRKAAMQDMMKQPGTKNWHPDALRVFVDKALCSHPASKFPEPWCFKGGVTLACSRAYEAASHLAHDYHDKAFAHLRKMYRDGKAIHLIQSAVNEFNIGPLLDEQALPVPENGRGPLSVQKISKGGHMFVQSNPKDTASAVWNILTSRVKSEGNVKVTKALL